MSDRIEANYEELERISQQFEQQAQAIQTMLQSINSAYGNLEGGGWIGEAADRYFAEMGDTYFPAVQRLINAFENASDSVMRIAETIANAEDEASQLFRRAR